MSIYVMGKIIAYHVTLDEEVVELAREYTKKHGGKLSPLINNLLNQYNNEEEQKIN